jgi:hypothetical protein
MANPFAKIVNQLFDQLVLSPESRARLETAYTGDEGDSSETRPAPLPPRVPPEAVGTDASAGALTTLNKVPAAALTPQATSTATPEPEDLLDNFNFGAAAPVSSPARVPTPLPSPVTPEPENLLGDFNFGAAAPVSSPAPRVPTPPPSPVTPEPEDLLGDFNFGAAAPVSSPAPRVPVPPATAKVAASAQPQSADALFSDFNWG